MILRSVVGWMLAGAAGLTPPGEGADVFYVSPTGRDDWSGRLRTPNADRTDGPFRTLTAARDAVRQHKAAGPVTVFLRGARYELAEPLVLGPEDSGTAERPITYAAYPDEKPILSGGRRITGLAADSDGRWTVRIPAAANRAWPFRQLFVNGHRRGRTRLPAEGYHHVAGFAGIDVRKTYATPMDRFEFAAGDISADWANLADVEVVALHYWVAPRLPIKSVDAAKRVVTFTRATRRRLTDDFHMVGARYYVENVREALAPGRWYLDTKTGTLEWLPAAGERMAGAEVIAPRLPQLVRLIGDPKTGRRVEHVRFVGLTFSHNEWRLPADDAGDLQAAVIVPGAVECVGAAHCAFERCTFSHLGTYAMDIGDGCRDIRVVRNEMTDLGAGGVKISGGAAGSPAWQRTGKVTVADNHIHHGGEIFQAGIGVLLRHADANRIAHNHIHHFRYTGVSVGWVWGYKPSVAVNNRIEFNHIHHIGQGVLSDMGGIYTLGPSKGTVLAHNVIHDVESHGYGGWGLYTDEGSTGILLVNNVVYRTKTGSFHQHYGRENIVRNNILAFSATDQLQRTRAEKHLSFTFERNIVYFDNGKLLGKNWRGEQFKMDHNLYWNAAGEPIDFAGATLAQWRAKGHDVHSIVADPLFVDPRGGDFRLKGGSPAGKIGFEPIDVSRVGVRPAEKK